jgi:hypothetical protein
MYSSEFRETQKWLAQNRGLMVDCPNQPGKLLISKNACRKRYKASLNPDLKFHVEDFFRYAFKQGLSLCRNCRIGRQLVRA